MSIVWAILPFIIFILYDINSVKWEISVFRKLFLFGVALIIINTTVIILNNYTVGLINLFYLIPALLCLFMLVYSVFFALPFQETYTSNKNPASLCRTGLYAMCRHPGGLWFAGFYFFLSLVFPSGELALFSFVSCACNVVYIAFQDAWSFPRTFSDYHVYKAEVPFLFPNWASFRNGLGTLKNRGLGKS